MDKLRCDVCGGKLIGKPGGVFECDSCGVEYSNEWAKSKVQEIKGTVKIEGPIHVEGTVTVAGGITVENLLLRAQEFESTYELERAEEYYNRVLDIDPQNTMAKEGVERIHTAADIKVGNSYEGVVTKLLTFGCFVQLLASGKEGMVHISNICSYIPKPIESIISAGDRVKVTVTDIDAKGRINLTMREDPEQLRRMDDHYQKYERYQAVVVQQQKNAALRAELELERDNLKQELAQLKGIFSNKRRRDIETRLAEIEKELEET